MSNRRSKNEGLVHKWREYGLGSLFMLPWLIGFSVFLAFPLGWSLFMSFNKVRFTSEGFKFEWIFLQNYKDALFKDNVYPVELLIYFQQVILMIPIILIFSLFVSLFLNQPFPGRFLFRAVFFLPVIFATGQVLMELFSQGAGELPFMDQYDVEPLIREYASERFAAPILKVLKLAVLILWYSGVQIIIFIAGFQTIQRSVYEAVRIDGATPWESFWKITLPATVPFIGLNMIYTIVDLFTFPTNPVINQVKQNMFKPDTGYGYASALAWLYFILILLLILAAFVILNRSGKRGEGARR